MHPTWIEVTDAGPGICNLLLRPLYPGEVLGHQLSSTVRSVQQSKLTVQEAAWFILSHGLLFLRFIKT